MTNSPFNGITSIGSASRFFVKVELFFGQEASFGCLRRVIRYNSLGYFTLFTLLCVGLSCGRFGIVEESYGG